MPGFKKSSSREIINDEFFIGTIISTFDEIYRENSFPEHNFVAISAELIDLSPAHINVRFLSQPFWAMIVNRAARTFS